jgi:type IV pilus biogenesis protein CpaD/CtpE
MTIQIRKAVLLVVAALTLAACASHNPYNDPGAQRDRSKGAQDEMRRDTSKY